MYAIIESGGKQHKVFEGEVLRLEKLDAEPGATVNFSNVLFLAMDDKVTVGAPYVENAQVVAEVVEQGRGEKIRIIKFHRRKHHQKSTGHRQYYTDVKITEIGLGATAKPKAAKAKTEDAPTQDKPVAKTAAKKPVAKKSAAKKPAAKKPATKAADKKPAAKKTTSKTAAAKKPAKGKTGE